MTTRERAGRRCSLRGVAQAWRWPFWASSGVPTDPLQRHAAPSSQRSSRHVGRRWQSPQAAPVLLGALAAVV